MKIKATIVSENCVFHLPGAIAEHGLAIFMETDRGNYLLDTGQGKTIVNNAMVLGLDLRTIRGIIISHHHWDHTGGLGPVLDLKGAVDIYAHPDFFKESYSVTKMRHVTSACLSPGAPRSQGGRIQIQRRVSSDRTGIVADGGSAPTHRL